MHHKRPKGKKKKTTQKTGPGKTTLAAVIFGTALLLTILMFISAKLAVLGLGFLSFAAYVYLDNNRRRFWEKNISSKIKAVKDEQEKISREVARNSHDIGTLKEGANKKPPAPEPSETRPAKPATVRRTPPVVTIANEDTDPDYDSMSDTIVTELVHHSLRNRRVEVFVQPIVRLPQRQTRFYEIFARIRARPGLYVPAGRYMSVAMRDKVMNEVDYLLLKECLNTLKLSAHIKDAAPFFLNITSATLKNIGFMKQLLSFLSENRHLASRLIFEIRQDDFEAMQPAILEILRGLGKLGCSLSIDNVETFEFDLKFLQVLKVRFVKIDTDKLLKMARTDKGATEIWRLKRKLEGNGIGFIVHKIENEFALKELLDFDIHYGQGHLFGKPDLQGAYKKKDPTKRRAA